MNFFKIGALMPLAAAVLVACQTPVPNALLVAPGVYIYEIDDQSVRARQQDVSLVATALECDRNGIASVDVKAEAFGSGSDEEITDSIEWRLRDTADASNQAPIVGRGETATIRVDCFHLPRTHVSGPIIGRLYSLQAVASDAEGNGYSHAISLQMFPLPL